MAKQIFVTGHKSPDTDSICSSIAYAKLKQLQGIDATPIRAGEPNKETAFALDYFHVAPQPLVKDFYVKVSEAVHTEVEALPVSASLKDAAKWFASHESDVAPVADNGQFVGVIEKSQLADEFIKTVMGEELSTVKGLAHDPELFFKPTDNGHDIPADGKYAVVENGKYVGMICADCVAAAEKQPVILVDHNEKKQIIDGIDEASIVGVIDHHRIGGTLETAGPISILFKPVGCTATIVTGLYEQAKIDIPKDIAGLLLSAVISDTVLFRSPTCTPKDEKTARELAEIVGVDIEKYAFDMFSAGSNLKGKTIKEIFYQDFKHFKAGKVDFGVSQVTSLNKEELESMKDELEDFALEAMKIEGIDMSFIMLTNILERSTDLLAIGAGAGPLVNNAFAVESVRRPARSEDGKVLDAWSVELPGVVSRKKQLVPQLTLFAEQL